MHPPPTSQSHYTRSSQDYDTTLDYDPFLVMPVLDQPSAADSARLRISKRRGLFNVFSLPGLWKSKKSVHHQNSLPQLFIPVQPDSLSESAAVEVDRQSIPSPVVQLDDAPIANDVIEDKDVYKWAIVYENQRGYSAHL